MWFRLRRRGALVAALCCMAAQPSRAQSIGNMLVTDVKNSAGDIWAVWTSPFHAGTKDWLLAAGALAGSAAISPLDASIDQWAAHHRDDDVFNFLNPVREGGVAFSGKTITPIAVGTLAVALVIKNQRVQEGLFGCLSAYASTSAVRTFVVYPLIARTRPDSSRTFEPPPARQGDQYHFDFPGSNDWGRHSFPGGHIANVAACASFLTNRFAMGFMEPVAWAVVGGVGIGRTLDRRHWTSDQVFGLLFGLGAGRVVAIRSSHRANRANAANGLHGNDDDSFLNHLVVEPSSLGQGYNVGWKYTF